MRAALMALALLWTGAAHAADPMTAPTFRVCADPDDLPYSNRAGEGFENRIAEVLAAALGRPVEYAWFPYGIGFVRQTLLRDRCDVILDAVRPHEGIALTRPYMRAGYALVATAGSLPEDLSWIDDPRIAGLRVGVVTGSPPAAHLAALGRIPLARPYRPVVDRPHGAPTAQMVDDLRAGRTDAIFLWWPLAARLVAASDSRLSAHVVVAPARSPALIYQVSLAVRRNEPEWRDLLDRLLDENAGEIARILGEFQIPAVRAGGG